MLRRLALSPRLACLLLPAALVTLAVAPQQGRSASSAPAALAPASAAPHSFYETPFERKPEFKTLVALGRSLFSDRTLSASGRVSCASCHDPAHAYGPPNRLPVQRGGPALNLPGLRAVPSLTYHQTLPNFQPHFFDNDGNDSEDQGPTGGLDWDGRADSAHEQAAGPLLSPFEMANKDNAAVVAKLKSSPNAAAMRDAFGAHVFDDATRAWNGLLLALEAFQQSPADFYPYADPVLADMLRRLGTQVEAANAPFQPEAGAYGGGHKHGHDATFAEDYALAQQVFGEHHGHSHSHDHDHDHDHQHGPGCTHGHGHDHH